MVTTKCDYKTAKITRLLIYFCEGDSNFSDFGDEKQEYVSQFLEWPLEEPPPLTDSLALCWYSCIQLSSNRKILDVIACCFLYKKTFLKMLQTKFEVWASMF